MYASQGIHNGSPADDSRGFYPDPWESLYVLIRFDESVLAVVAFIYDACAIGLPVIENEEVMAEHVHLQYCLFRIHRFQLELFGADDVVFRIGFVVLFLPEFMVRVHFQFGEEVLLRILLPELAVDLRLMLSDLPFEFVHDQVDRRIHILVLFLRSQSQVFHRNCDFDFALLVAVSLDIDMCMCVRSICKVTFQLADLFLYFHFMVFRRYCDFDCALLFAVSLDIAMCMCVRSICKVTFQLADLFLDVVPDCICYLNIFSSNFTSDHSEPPPSMRYTSCFYYIRVFRLLKTLTHPRRQAFLCKFFQAPDVQ